MSDALQALANAAVVDILITPGKALMRDLREIASNYQLPEHISHAVLLTTALVAGSALPFVDPAYGGAIGGVIESLGLSGGLQTFATWGLSTWLVSYPTSSFLDYVNKLGRKYVSGDWNYRLTHAHNLEIEAELTRLAEEEDMPDIKRNSAEIRAIFNYCVEKMKKNPVGKGEGFKLVLEELLRGDLINAIADFEERKSELEKLTADSRQRLAHYRRKNQTATKKAPEPEEEKKDTLEMQQRSRTAPHLRVDGPATVIKEVAYVTDELTAIPNENGAGSVAIKIAAPQDRSAAATPARQPTSRRGSGKDSLTRAERQLHKRVAELEAAVGQRAHTYSVAHQDEAVDTTRRAELLRTAQRLRYEVIMEVHKIGGIPTTEIERTYSTHCDTLAGKSDADLEGYIAKDRKKLADLAAGPATAGPAMLSSLDSSRRHQEPLQHQAANGRATGLTTDQRTPRRHTANPQQQ